MVKEKSESIKYLKFFLIVVFLGALISIVYKGYLLVRNSSFKHNSLNILLLDRDAYLVHLDREKKRIAIFKFPAKRTLFLNKSNLYSAVLIGTPVDGVVTSQNELAFSEIEKNFFPSDLIFKMIFDNSFKIRGINQFDLIKIYIATNSLSKKDLVDQQIADMNSDFRKNNQLDNFSDIISDRDILNDNTSIEIINSTGIDGLGNRISKMLKTSGFNVVTLGSQDNKKSGIIVRSDESITALKLKELFGLTEERATNKSIADISVILGRDMAHLFN